MFGADGAQRFLASEHFLIMAEKIRFHISFTTLVLLGSTAVSRSSLDFWHDSTERNEPRSPDCEADAVAIYTTAPVFSK